MTTTLTAEVPGKLGLIDQGITTAGYDRWRKALYTEPDARAAFDEGYAFAMRRIEKEKALAQAAEDAKNRKPYEWKGRVWDPAKGGFVDDKD